VSNVGNATREIQVQLEAQDTLTRQTVEAEQSFSGVNLDEEAAQLIRNQQAYQASAKVLQIASSLFQSVLELG
jgi:flagellar hook-associated protein 1 FlgK